MHAESYLLLRLRISEKYGERGGTNFRSNYLYHNKVSLPTLLTFLSYFNTINFYSNPLFSYMLDGSAIKQAVDMGKTGNLEKCASLYMKCPVSKENITQIITNLLPS